MISVLMTCYNREKYIGQAIESVLLSSFKNFELIIVDDCSSDDTISIARSFAEKDARIKIYINENNLGDYPNRIHAANLASGKYIKYVDSDDAIYPYCLETMVNAMESFPDAGLGMASIEPNPSRSFPFMLSPEEAYNYHFFCNRIFHKGPLDSIIKLDAYKSVGGFLPGRMISDTDFWFRIVLRYPVVLLPEGLVWQRRHQNQELSAANDFLVDKEKIKWRYLLTKECKLSTEKKKLIKQHQLKTFFKFSLSQLYKLHIKEATAYFKCFIFVYRVKIN